ncbi:MAG: anhydro-N-acetylmuramic acid kinase [Hyphomicrobiales bacterium]|nr:anhydro-N-acetylmuramic acid kinase [Hyphomicrobiales bacterium]
MDLKQRASARPLVALGLMSGTSLDGIDAAVVTTDGERTTKRGSTFSMPYEGTVRQRLRAICGRKPLQSYETESRLLTKAHADAVQSLLSEAGLTARDVDVIGFHGQTIWHSPETLETIQIGDGQWLANRVGVPVVDQFRVADVTAGGQGAPFAPLFHAALTSSLDKPLAVLNIGGVANVTWIGTDSAACDGPLLAFDTGTGNALIDDWTHLHTGQNYDCDGQLAAGGRVDHQRVALWLQHPYFTRQPPKSLDRDEFRFVLNDLEGFSAADGAATLTALTVGSITRSLDFMPVPPERILVCGGGRHNKTMLRSLAEQLNMAVEPIEVIGWDGDFIEAQAFAYLAVRSLRAKPLSLPSTTGVPAPQTGGQLWLPQR